MTFHSDGRRDPAAVRLVLAFAAIYLIWGSTYLAILIALETMPPFLMAGTRFVTAGLILYAWSRWRGAPRPTPAHWRSTAVIGVALLMGGNGGVVYAEQRVESGIAALLVATVPFWMVLLAWLKPRGQRPSASTIVGVVTGMAGVVLLVMPSSQALGAGVDWIGAAILVGASLSWSAGSIYSQHAQLPSSALLATAMEMLAGGATLLVAGTLTGEWSRLDPAAVSWRSAGALAYLIVFGALIGYSAYIWLLKVTTPARVSTYAYVNPVVAMLLGWLMAGEALSGRRIVAAGVILTGVIIITTQRNRAASAKRAAAGPSAPKAEPREATVCASQR